jgi:hypothetical protein
MKRTPFLALALALACGSVDERPDCSTSVDCPVGQYCAHTADGNVCWEDAVDPAVAAVTVTCPSPCPRDATLTVSATVTDDVEVLEVVAALDLDPTVEVPLARVGATDTFQGEVDLSAYAFPFFSAEVIATVTGRDGARNEVGVAAQGANVKTVTRLRWSAQVDPEIAGIIGSPPAVRSDGTVVVGGSNGKLYFIAPDGTRPIEPVVVASGSPIGYAPSIGASAIWVVAGATAYALSQADGAKLNGDTGCALGADALGPIAVATATSPETGYVVPASNALRAVYASTSTCVQSPVVGPPPDFLTGGSIDAAGNLLVLRTGPALQSFAFAGGFVESLLATLTGTYEVAPSIASADGAWLGTADTTSSKLQLVTASGSVEPSIPVGASVRSQIAVLADGDVVASEGSYLRRFSPAGTARWNPTSAQLGGAGLTPMVLRDGATITFLVPTRNGRVNLIADDGGGLWGDAIGSGFALLEGNLHTPSGSSLSYAYFTSADGKLHQVVVDGALDTSAPWPKAWHDPRNTGNAASGF